MQDLNRYFSNDLEELKKWSTSLTIIVQSLSRVWTLCDSMSAAHQASLSFSIFYSFLKFMCIELVMLCNHLMFFCSLLLSPSIFTSIRVFSNESAVCTKWPKYWKYSFSMSPSSEYSGLIPFRIDWFDLLAVQGTLKNLFQHHNLKAAIFGTQPFVWSNSHLRTWLHEKPQLWLYGPAF